MLRVIYIYIVFTLNPLSCLSEQLLGDVPDSADPMRLYERYDCDRVHAYIPKSEIPDRYPISVKGFVMPLHKVTVTSVYGVRWNKLHRGIDLLLDVGDTVYAAFDGYVRLNGYEKGGYGKFRVLRHENGLETVYGHLSESLLEEGAKIKAGQPIGLGGNSGRSTGPHLHFETLFMGLAIDPRRIIDFKKGSVHNMMFYYTKDKIRIPVKSGNNHVIRCHRVEKGETLVIIAQRYAVTVDELCRYNHLSPKAKLRTGQIIRYS